MQGVRQKSTAGVSGIRRGHFFAVRRSRCPHICKKEVINMLIAEYDYDIDIAVQREEASKIAFAQGISQGISQGIEQGIERGIEQGFSDGVIKTALAFKKMGIPIAKIAEGTGLTQAEVEKL